MTFFASLGRKYSGPELVLIRPAPLGSWERKIDAQRAYPIHKRCVARFSLVVEIDATEAEVDLYAEVEQKVAPQAEIQV